MAITVERMVAVLEARLDKFEKGVEKARKQAVGDFNAITTAGTNMEKSLSGLAANSNRAFGNGGKGADKFQKSVQGARVETSNLAAQLNDIGVQLAGGQNPFLIAIQQGSQINQVLGQAGARGAVAALAGAFTSLVNPVSLATIALIAGGGAAVQYITELLSGTEEAKPAIKEQERLIRSLAERWGEVIPPLKEYVQELDRAKVVAEAQQGGTALADVQWATIRDELAAFNDEYDDYITAITIAGNATGSQRTALSDLGTAFVDLQSKIEAGTATQEDFDRARAAATQAAAMEGAEELGIFVTALDTLNNALDAPLAKLQQLQPLLGGQARLLDPSTWRGAGVNPAFENENIQNSGFTTPEIGPVPGGRPLIELGTDDGSRSAKSRSKAISEAERERKAVADLIEQLEFEQSTIGMTDAERAEANALRRAGAAATEEQKARISELVEATYAERDAIKANKDAMDELNATARDVLEGMVSDLRAGKSAADIFANALGRIADKLLSGAFDSLFGGSGGGLGGLFSGLLGRGRGTSYFPPAPRALGGPVTAGQPYIVGEKRPELFVPNVSGRIIPKVPSGGAPVTVDARTTFQASGNRETDQEMMRALAKRDAELPALIVKTVRDAQKRRAI